MMTLNYTAEMMGYDGKRSNILLDWSFERKWFLKNQLRHNLIIILKRRNDFLQEFKMTNPRSTNQKIMLSTFIPLFGFTCLFNCFPWWSTRTMPLSQLQRLAFSKPTHSDNMLALRSSHIHMQCTHPSQCMLCVMCGRRWCRLICHFGLGLRWKGMESGEEWF